MVRRPNPYDPNVDPMRWYAFEISENKRQYTDRFPEEKRVHEWEAANFHRPIKGLSAKKKSTKTRRRG